jgi:hypothetical protein
LAMFCRGVAEKDRASGRAINDRGALVRKDMAAKWYAANQ